MQNFEQNAVAMVARVAPWLAPLPNAYFVARSGMVHLALPLPMALVAGLVLELLGIATVHTALELYRWNLQPSVQREKGGWERAPLALAMVTCGVYFAAVVFLAVVLESVPELAQWAPALFPLVALTGALTLAIVYQHRARVARYVKPKTERQNRRKSGRQNRRQRGVSMDVHRVDGGVSKEAPNFPILDTNLTILNDARLANRKARMDALLAVYLDNPDTGPTEAGRAIGVSRQTVYNYLEALESAGRVRRNGDGVEVVDG